MKMYRVMFNDLKRGTGVQQDHIGTERKAKELVKKLRKEQPRVNFFHQEYEESRGENGIGVDGS